MIMEGSKANVQHGVWQNTGGLLLSSAFVILLCIGSGFDIYYLAFVFIFIKSFSINFCLGLEQLLFPYFAKP